jgi:hypothetical protein
VNVVEAEARPKLRRVGFSPGAPAVTIRYASCRKDSFADRRALRLTSNDS